MFRAGIVPYLRAAFLSKHLRKSSETSLWLNAWGISQHSQYIVERVILPLFLYLGKILSKADYTGVCPIQTEPGRETRCG